MRNVPIIECSFMNGIKETGLTIIFNPLSNMNVHLRYTACYNTNDMNFTPN